ncbi:MAG: DUF1361 domain-containing protein [Gaiellaceae bacterium]
MRSRVILPLAALLAASAWCVLLLVVRKHEFGAAGYRYLVWNLTLAWIPLLLAILLVVSYARRRSPLELVAVGGLWLLFLPNAPYVLTDFIHLGDAHRLYDSLLVGSFAFTGLALGFASLLLVQLVVTRAGGALLGWATALVALFSASVGIYLGRVLRLNSWDALQRPSHLWDIARMRLADPLGNRYLLGFVVLYCGFLTLTYVGFYGFTSLVATVRRGD